MNPSRDGLSSAGKAGVVVVLVVLVLGAFYLAPSLMKGGGTKSTSSIQPEGPSPDLANNQTAGMFPLFSYFSQMKVSVLADDASDDPPTNSTFSYMVLGEAPLNSLQDLRVEFLTLGAGSLPHEVIAWFNPIGGIDRADVLGQSNYTGSGAHLLPQVQSYIMTFSFILAIADNATLLSHMSQTSVGTVSIGHTQLSVTTYSLTAPSGPYSSLTVEYATIPGTSTKIAVSLSEKATDGSTVLAQITGFKQSNS
jgi:hypothetical protein